jgi:hypothetical protein
VGDHPQGQVRLGDEQYGVRRYERRRHIDAELSRHVNDEQPSGGREDEHDVTLQRISTAEVPGEGPQEDHGEQKFCS